MMDRSAQLKQIKDEVLNLVGSPLYEERIKNKNFPVIGEGSHTASIMFIGEAPGKNEAMTGRPFVGRAGKVLDELLEGAGIPRSEVYITNIVKDRPPMNRDPYPDEIALYGPFLDRQIDIIQPKVLATLGRFSMTYILTKFNAPEKLDPISKLHGLTIDAHASYGSVTIIPLYHPAVAVYNSSMKETLAKDFQVLKNFV